MPRRKSESCGTMLVKQVELTGVASSPRTAYYPLPIIASRHWPASPVRVTLAASVSTFGLVAGRFVPCNMALLSPAQVVLRRIRACYRVLDDVPDGVEPASARAAAGAPEGRCSGRRTRPFWSLCRCAGKRLARAGCDIRDP